MTERRPGRRAGDRPAVVVPAGRAAGSGRRLRFRPPPPQPPAGEWQALDARPEPAPARLIALAPSRLGLGPLRRARSGRGPAAYPPRRLLPAVLYMARRGWL